MKKKSFLSTLLLKVHTVFLEIVILPDGKAVTIHIALVKFVTDHGLDPQSMVGLGPDGASVMVGKKGGVSRPNSWRVNVAFCITMCQL